MAKNKSESQAEAARQASDVIEKPTAPTFAAPQIKVPEQKAQVADIEPTKVKATHNTSKGKRGKLRGNKLAIIIAVTLIIVAGMLITFDKATKPTVPKGACSGEVMDRIVKAMTKNTVEDLQPVVQDIQKLPNYDKDPNCMFIIAKYYVLRSDYNNAQSSATSLEKADTNGKHIHIGDLYKGSVAFDTLKNQIDFLKKQDQQMQQSTNEQQPSFVIPSERVEQP